MLLLGLSSSINHWGRQQRHKSKNVLCYTLLGAKLVSFLLLDDKGNGDDDDGGGEVRSDQPPPDWVNDEWSDDPLQSSKVACN